MAKNGTIAFVREIPKCDFKQWDGCELDAEYDFAVKFGSWAFGCEAHWKKYRLHEELGIGSGQKLVLRSDQEKAEAEAEAAADRIGATYFDDGGGE